MTMTRTRACAAAAAFICAAPGVVPTLAASARATSASTCQSGHVHRHGVWLQMDAPRFPPVAPADQPLQSIQAFAADPTKPGRLFVTNGSVVFRSVDAGCSWQQVFTMTAPHVRESTANAVADVQPGGAIADVVVAGGGYVYLVGGQGEFAQRPVVFASKDGGASFAEADTGAFPEAGYVREGSLAAGPGRPAAVLAVVDAGPFGAEPVLEQSPDAGGSWSMSAAAITTAKTGTPSNVAFDPRDRSIAYLWGSRCTLLKSTDGGQTFSGRSGTTTVGGAEMVAVGHPRHGGPFAVMSDGSQLFELGPTGNFGALEAPIPVTGVAVGANDRQILAIVGTSNDRRSVMRYSARIRKWRTVTPGPGVFLLRSVNPDHPQFYATNGTALFRYIGALT